MQRKDAKTIILYFKSLQDMRALLWKERMELEAEYCGLSAVNMDGMPHGTTPGNPVEGIVVSMETSGDAERIREIERQLAVLEADRRQIQGALDAVNGKYKSVLSLRYLSGYSWGKISACTGVADSTVRHWHEKALVRFGRVLEDGGEVSGILHRASHAHV